MERSTLLACSLVFVLALGLRLEFVRQTQGIPEFRTPPPGLDVDLHWQAAQELRRRDGTGPNFALRMASAPGHIAFLALNQAVLGDSLVRHRVLRSLLGAVSTLLIYWASWSLTRSRWAALASGLAAASLPSLVYFQTMVLKPALSLPLLALLLAVVFRPVAPTRPLGLGIGVGAVVGLLWVIQRNTFLYLLVLIVYFAADPSQKAKNRLRTVLATGLAFAMVAWAVPAMPKLLGISPPLFLPVAGVHARVGFHSGANGAYHALEGIPDLPYGHAFVSRLRAEIETGRMLTPAEADRHHLARSWRFVRENRGEASTLVLRKLALLFNDYEVKGNQQLDRIRSEAPILDRLPLGFGSLLILAIWGVVAVVEQGRRRALIPLLGIAAAVVAANVLTFVTWRYRIDLVVPMLVLAGPGALWLARGLIDLGRSGPGRRRRIGGFGRRVLLPAVIAAVIAFRPVDPELDATASRGAQRNAELSRRAEVTKARLAEIECAGDPARGETLRVRLLVRLHRHSEAFQRIEGMLAQGRFDPLLIARFLTYLAWLDEPGRAAGLLSRLERQAPGVRAAALRRLDPLVGAWLELETGTKKGAGERAGPL